jgi:hypothetical protein
VPRQAIMPDNTLQRRLRPTSWMTSSAPTANSAARCGRGAVPSPAGRVSVSMRVSPCERLHAQIEEVFAGGGDLAGAIERVAQLGAQLLWQAAIEGEVAAFCGPRALRTRRDLRNARPSGSPPSCSAPG